MGLGRSVLLVLHQLHHQPLLLRSLQQNLQKNLHPDTLLPNLEGKTPEWNKYDVTEENDGVVVVVRQPPATVVMQESGEDVVIERKPRGDVTEKQSGARGDAQQQE